MVGSDLPLLLDDENHNLHFSFFPIGLTISGGPIFYDFVNAPPKKFHNHPAPGHPHLFYGLLGASPLTPLRRARGVI